MSYNDPAGGTPSDIGNQIVQFAHIRKVLTEIQKKKTFSQLADTYTQPKNHGKIVKQDLILPILHDGNINNQGIDASGATTTKEVTILLFTPGVDTSDTRLAHHVVGEGADAALALTAAKAEAVNLFKNLQIFDTDYATTVGVLTALGWTINDSLADVPVSGNLYGSSNDMNYIKERLPMVGEHGGRKNRVGLTRITIEGTFSQLGFFAEYTKNTANFDTTPKLVDLHVNREMIRAAHKVSEDHLQINLLNGAGVILFTGAATSKATLSGEAGAATELSYRDFTNAETMLDNNDCPTDTTIITGSLMTDTQVISAARIMYAGPELKNTLEALVDPHGNPALTKAVHYADGGKLLNGEYGSIGGFRIVINKEMMKFRGVGANVVSNGGFYASNGKYDGFPLLVVGDKSFTNIGFELAPSSTSTKFDIIHKRPSKETADRNDPYGLTGFMSILWNEGILLQRPERIALITTIARY